jgi:hypothetical protein
MFGFFLIITLCRNWLTSINSPSIYFFLLKVSLLVTTNCVPILHKNCVKFDRKLEFSNFLISFWWTNAKQYSIFKLKLISVNSTTGNFYMKYKVFKFLKSNWIDEKIIQEEVKLSIDYYCRFNFLFTFYFLHKKNSEVRIY